MTAPLEGRRVLVTGASSGIGEAVVRRCVERGAHVAALARRADRLDGLAAEVGAVPIVVDLADVDAAQIAVDQAANRLDGLDAVVNSAGVYLLGGLEHGSVEDWRTMFDVNVLSLLAVTQTALPYLEASTAPHVINIGSIGGRRVARVSTAVYSATKFAVAAISEGMRQELHPRGIRVSLVSPGVVRTELGVGTRDASLLSAVQQKQAAIGIAPDAVARAVTYALEEPPEVAVHEIVVLPVAQPM